VDVTPPHAVNRIGSCISTDASRYPHAHTSYTCAWASPWYTERAACTPLLSYSRIYLFYKAIMYRLRSCYVLFMETQPLQNISYTY